MTYSKVLLGENNFGWKHFILPKYYKIILYKNLSLS